jgi:hypothetical protein
LRSFFVFSFVFLIVGCVSKGPHDGVTFTRYTKETFPPTTEVEVFSEDVEKPYTIIGELKMVFSPELGDEEMVNRMKEVARGVGADAIVGFEREVVEVAIPEAFPEPIKRKARHQPLDISSPEANEEKILLRGLVIRYR